MITDKDILAALVEKRKLLDQAIAAFQETMGAAPPRRRGRPPASAAAKAEREAGIHEAPPAKRKLSVAARKRISAAQRARWATQKKAKAG